MSLIPASPPGLDAAGDPAVGAPLDDQLHVELAQGIFVYVNRLLSEPALNDKCLRDGPLAQPGLAALRLAS
jgi:hypothetical protein